MLKRVCDFCGKDALNMDFILPFYVHVRGGKDNSILMHGITVYPGDAHFCRSCAEMIAAKLEQSQNSK
jgi:hypothetical protein